MITVNISNHPVHNTITRTATLLAINLDYKTKLIYTNLGISHYLDGVSLPQLDKEITLLSDNTIQVPTGIEEETKGDYDIFVERGDNGDSYKTIVIDGINMVDMIGKINQKMSY